MTRPEKLAFKTFWKKVNSQLTGASVEELRAILRALAQETLPTERQML